MVVFVMLVIPTSQYVVYGQTSNNSSPFDFSNQSRTKSILTNATSLSDFGKYNATQINQIIFALYDDYLRSDKKADHDHFHRIAMLLDFICSNELYEDTIEACDYISEFPID